MSKAKSGLDPFSTAIDNSFVDALVKEKFIEKVFGEKLR
jgi:hypothetical protein